VATPTRPVEANAIDVGRTLAAVRTAKRQASVVIVLMQWGTEGQACPDEAHLSLARQLAAPGASIIVGAHAHMLRGSGWLGRTFVAWPWPCSASSTPPAPRPMTSSAPRSSLLTCTRTPGSSPASQGSAH
jgi:hypothetical protein